jgi:hypothetical protein
MNKAYRSVWNEAAGTWVAAQENAKGKSKGSARVEPVILAAGIAAAALLGAPGSVFAAEMCIKDYNGTAAVTGMSTKTAPFTTNGCQPNFYTPPGASDIAELEAGGSVVYTDGTNGMVGFRATTTGAIVTINSSGLLTNIAQGAITASSRDAVNGSQLYTIGTSVAASLGGGSTLGASGAVSAPSYALSNANAISGTTGAKTDVGTAFATVDTALGQLQGNVTTINGQITNINGKLNDAVLYDSSAHTSVTLGASGASAPVKLLNVANGQRDEHRRPGGQCGSVRLVGA